jgi:hypothetical protein
MSMRNFANHGYVVKAIDLGKLMAPENAKRWVVIVEEHGSTPWVEGDVPDELEKLLPAGSPVPFLFVPDEDTETEDLEIGEMYAQFDEADLFEMTPTPFMRLLNELSMRPENAQWVTYS